MTCLSCKQRGELIRAAIVAARAGDQNLVKHKAQLLADSFKMDAEVVMEDIKKLIGLWPSNGKK